MTAQKKKDKIFEIKFGFSLLTSGNKVNGQKEKFSERHFVINGEKRKISYSHLHCGIIDVIFLNITERFATDQQLLFLNLLDSKHFPNKTIFSDTEFSCLQQNYGNYFDLIYLKNELIVVFSDPDTEEEQCDETSQLNSIRSLKNQGKECILYVTILSAPTPCFFQSQ